ncbi:MAG: acetyl-CoA decarbonylase/synthase complex subunit delta [Candidatus Omnitrophica bacterium]|nr:acetyl-CoA decarbonylase/synthase complex subunit delta [Candidatus Omnitrophota bacterium]
MALELIKETWSSSINTVTIGATKQEGGSRGSTITVGGETGLSFLHQETKMPHQPQLVFEIWDIEPDWPDSLKAQYDAGILKNTLEWAKVCKEKFQAKGLALRLAGIHPDNGNKPADSIVKLVQDLLKTVDLPLIILGCNDEVKDNEVLPKISEATKGERLLFGEAVQDNYKTLVVSLLADGHSIIAQSPIDINIAKQLNILISDMGFPAERIVINPTVGALGYGLEYAYSIMERARLAALAGDTMLAMPFVCLVGQEAWRAKEAKATSDEVPEWGSQTERGLLWEALTASTFLQAGADLLVMRHPQAVKSVQEFVDKLMEK